jgi:FixJ family two-component response regulator
LTKPFVPDALLSAVRGAIERSRAVLDAQLAVRGLRARFELLTPRERQVMELVVDGRLNKEVGGELGISEITVKAHRGRVMQKLQAGSLADLVRMATSLGYSTRTDR